MLGESRLVPGFVAIVLGVAAASIFFVPYLALAYRKSGRVTLGRSLGWLCFLIYLLALWTYTLLPLPSPSALHCTKAQFHLGATIDDIRRYGTSSVQAIANNPAVMQVALNVVLFIPLGFFLRWLTERGWFTITVIGMGISVLIEATQYTGVWFIYPCSYRVCDVDDLVTNTAGALLGAGLSAPLLLRKNKRRGVAVMTRGRRFLGAFSDWWIVGLVSVAGGLAARLIRVYVLGQPVGRTLNASIFGLPVLNDPSIDSLIGWGVALVATGVVALASGKTPGDWVVDIRWEGSRRAKRLLRFVGGIGGYEILSELATPLGSVFLVVSIVLVFTTTQCKGLAGLASGQVPVIDQDNTETSAAGEISPS